MQAHLLILSSFSASLSQSLLSQSRWFSCRSIADNNAVTDTAKPMSYVSGLQHFIWVSSCFNSLFLQRALRPWLRFQRTAAGRGFRCLLTLCCFKLGLFSPGFFCPSLHSLSCIWLRTTHSFVCNTKYLLRTMGTIYSAVLMVERRRWKSCTE